MKLPPSRRGIALVLILGVIVIITIMAVGLSAVMRTERAVAKSNLDSVQARAFAEMAVDDATGLIRQAIDAGSTQGRFWASQGGKITVFEADGTVNPTLSGTLYSIVAGAGTGTINLNQTSFSGNSPIASSVAVNSGSAPALDVQWINVLEDPSSAANEKNKIAGRYAFWVDDETSKINLNTSDGTAKYTNSWFGSGTPADIALEALNSGGGNIPEALAGAIANETGIKTQGASAAPRYFNSPFEVARVNGAGVNLFQNNNFNVTHYSLAPELNIFGEPRIPLTVSRTITSPSGVQTVNNAMVGDYNYKGTGVPGDPTLPVGRPLTQIYPSSKQLPNAIGGNPLSQTFEFERAMDNQRFSETDSDYEMGRRIANYLKGKNSAGDSIQWPRFPGSGAGFAAKYSDRQIDSIAMQILSLMKRTTLADHSRDVSLGPILGKGWLSDKPVKGLSRAPKLTEVVAIFSATPGSRKSVSTSQTWTVAEFSVKIFLEWYVPKEYEGYELTSPYDNNSVQGYQIGFSTTKSYLNCVDASPNDGEASPLGGYWMDNLLVVTDPTTPDGEDPVAGIDLYGNGTSNPDPDPVKAALYHPWRRKSSDGTYTGAGPGGSVAQPALRMSGKLTDASNSWKLGEYHCVGSHPNVLGATYPSKPGVTALKISGGLAIWARTASGSPAEGYNLEPVPLDSIRGPYYTGEPYSAVGAKLREAVLPLPKDGLELSVPGQVVVHWQVADPLVNSMPGDWVRTINPSASEITMQMPTGSTPTYYMNGQNTIAATAAGGDPKSLWLPRQSAEMTKNQRFPSAGYLQYIRTGMMPDKDQEDNAGLSLTEQRGTPYRSFNLSPSNSESQGTRGGAKYPDWAMLDLFTVPAALQPLGSGQQADLTAGGATAGRLNPNVPILPNGALVRSSPLQGLFKNQTVYRAVSSSPAPESVDEKALADAVQNYIAGLGRPLFMAGEICNVPEVAAYVYDGVNAAARSRNDLVRQTVGNLTTRSNTFTIWAVGQTIKKRPSNTGYGVFQDGDTVTGEARYEVLVERYLDLGVDGVPGNTANPGPDGVVGTPDDPVDAQYHPSMTYPLPYKYRVLQTRQITN